MKNFGNTIAKAIERTLKEFQEVLDGQDAAIYLGELLGYGGKWTIYKIMEGKQELNFHQARIIMIEGDRLGIPNPFEILKIFAYQLGLVCIKLPATGDNKTGIEQLVALGCTEFGKVMTLALDKNGNRGELENAI